MSDTETAEAIQQVASGKWHRVWWPASLERAGTCMTHVGSYKPEQHARRAVSEVPESDRCRTCFPPVKASRDTHRECGQPWVDHADDGVQMLCPERAR